MSAVQMIKKLGSETQKITSKFYSNFRQIQSNNGILWLISLWKKMELESQ